MRRQHVRRSQAANRHSQAIANRTRRGPRPRRLQLEFLEDRRMLADAPLLVDLQPSSDSGLLADDNLR